MIFRAIAKTSRTVTCELSGNTPYYAAEPYDIYVNGELHTEKETRNIFTLFSLQPDTLYSIRIKSASSEFTRDVRTNTESALIDVSAVRRIPRRRTYRYGRSPVRDRPVPGKRLRLRPGRNLPHRPRSSLKAT